MSTLAPFAGIPLDEALLRHLIDHHERVRLPRFERLWRYFRNELAPPATDGQDRTPPAQRVGLPRRLQSTRRPGADDRTQREVVIENDIGWRIHALVDFMFPAAPRLVSTAPDPTRRREIEAMLERLIDANGGVMLWQDAALLGSVYGHVDLLIDADALFAVRPERAGEVRSSRGSADANARTTTTSPPTSPPRDRPGDAAPGRSARSRALSPETLLHIEAVEAPRSIPLLSPHDYRALDAFIIHFEQPKHAVTQGSFLARLLASRFVSRDVLRSQRATTTVTEIRSSTHRQRYEDGRLVEETRNPLGRLPVVHIQNLSQPLAWEGLSDVEPLIPLQDELNTRLSDRANRVTMQSFRMWLGKGIEGFIDRPVGPGQMWMTDNENASIESFGGDADSPSERQHIEDLREALDKASGVTPAAAGHIKAKVGNLTSENALRISLMGTIAKVKRKRITYGRGIAQTCELALEALHRSGHFRTEANERGVEIAWPDPLPADETRRLQDALLKAQLGVPHETLRAELGYGERGER